MKKTSKTVSQYLTSLPEDRRRTIKAVRALVNKHLPEGYQEEFAWGGITWSVPLAVYERTYNDQAIAYVGLANQKNHIGLYLMCAYTDGPVRQKLVGGFKAAGKKLDMGNACLRFRELEELPLDVIADVVSSVPMKTYIEMCQSVHVNPKRRAER
jgi:hypothetical protein